MLFLKKLRLLLLLPLLISSASAAEDDIAKKFDDTLKPVADFLWDIVMFDVDITGQSLPLVLAILGGTAIFLTIYFKFLNFRALGLAFRTVKGKYTDKDAPGQITHFQALTAALSATVGLGNIAGVAVAVSMGGPGATFWMVLMGLCGMTTKFCECTLGVKYRKIDAQGRVHGGAMYYLSQGLKEKGWTRLGQVLAVLFAVMCVSSAIGAGNMFQVNQAASQMSDSFGIFETSKVGFGVILAVIVGLVIIGGIVAIARVTSFLIPLMCGMYVIVALAIIFTHLSDVGPAFAEIFSGAFSPEAVGGGFVGVLIQGIQRAAFSNEAGIGSSPIAHSAVKTRKPASEGMVALLEPFTDTVVVCTMTALVLIITGMWKVDAVVEKESVNLYQSDAMELVVGSVSMGDELRIISKEDEDKKKNLGARGKVWLSEDESGQQEVAWVNLKEVKTIQGIGKTSRAFGEKFAWFPKLLAVAVLLFAFSTMISWSYYGEQAVIYLCGGPHTSAILIYKLVFCCFVVVGSVASLDNVLKISDAMLFAMVIPNMIGLYVLLPVVKGELADFRKHVAEIDSK